MKEAIPRGTTAGSVNVGHYDVWRAHYGQTACGAIMTDGVPEPATMILPALAAAAGWGSGDARPYREFQQLVNA